MSKKEVVELKDAKIDKEGTLEHQKSSDDPKKKPSWDRHYFRLVGGTLYFYKDDKAKKATGFVALGKDVKVSDQTIEKVNAISISQEGETGSFTVGTNDAALASAWASAIRANVGKDAVALELKDGVVVKKMGFVTKAKKNIAGKALSSNMGKSAMKKVIDDDIKQLLSCIKNIIAVESGSRELADRLEKNTIKIAVKAYFLWENQTVPLSDFEKLEGPLKQSLRILLAVYDGIEKVKDPAMKAEVLDEKFTVVAVLLDSVKDALTAVLSPHVKPKSIQRIHDTFATIARRDFFLHSFSEPSLKPDVSHVITYVRSYIKKS
jgi:hypothetical protein